MGEMWVKKFRHFSETSLDAMNVALREDRGELFAEELPDREEATIKRNPDDQVIVDKLNLKSITKNRDVTSYVIMGRGCGAVGRAVASDARDPQIEFSHQQDFFNNLSVTVIVQKR